MSSIFDSLNTGTDSSFSFWNSYSGTSSNSLVSSLGDLNMIKSGVYKKALKAYYAKSESSDGIAETIKGSASADSNQKLSSLKDSSKKLFDTAAGLQKKDFNKVKSGEDILNDVKDLVSSYNSTINATKNMDSYSVLQTTVWTKDQVSRSGAMLSKVGITIGEDNTLSLDEEKFKSADLSTIKTLFSGSSSLASKLAQKGSSLYMQSANQLAQNTGNLTYTSSGIFG